MLTIDVPRIEWLPHILLYPLFKLQYSFIKLLTPTMESSLKQELWQKSKKSKDMKSHLEIHVYDAGEDQKTFLV